MRRIAVVSVVLAALAGGSAIVSLTFAGGADTPIAKPEAAAFARAVNLRTGDLPGSTPWGGEPGSPPEAAEFQKAFHCGHRGKARGRAVAAERSPLTDRYRELVGSIVVVMPSEALAQAEVAELSTPRGRVCLAHDFHLGTVGAETPGAATYEVKITFVPVAKLLGREAVALHVLARLKKLPSKGFRYTPTARFVYSVGVIFRVGVADILFITLSERRRFPVETERRLLSLLYSRAKAHTPRLGLTVGGPLAVQRAALSFSEAL